MKASKRPARTVVKRFLRQNPTATNDQVAKSLGVSQRLVTLARSELALEGNPVRAGSDFTSTLAKMEDGELSAMEALGVKQLEADSRALEARTGHPVTEEEQIQILSARIRAKDTPSQVLGGLVTVYQKLRPPAKERIGPREPLDFAGYVKRLSLLIQACGLEITQAALRSAGFEGQITLAERKNEQQDTKDRADGTDAPPNPGAIPSEYLAAAGGLPGRDAGPQGAGETEGQGGGGSAPNS